MFDLQKFAEDNVAQDYGDVLDEEFKITEDETDIPKEETEHVPETLVPDEKNLDDTSIPYKRFKEVIDKKNETEKLLAQYRERYGELDAPPQNFQSQSLPKAANPPQQIPPQEPPQLSENDIKQLDEIITQRAMQISGLSKEDIENLDYVEDNDPRVARWNHAKRLSEATVYNDIINHQTNQQQEFQRMNALRSQTIADYNNYVAQQQAAENFNAVQKFAENDFFNAQSDIDKQVIMESYARIRNNTAFPADVMVVRDFFSRAKAAYDARQTAPPPKPKTKPTANNFPRTNKVNGIIGNGGGVSEATLAEMLRNKPWTQIPPEYQQALLGLT